MRFHGRRRCRIVRSLMAYKRVRGWTSLVKNLSWALSCMGSPLLTIPIKLVLWIVMIPPEKRMSWNRFPTNFVCVRFFLVLFCFLFFAVSYSTVSKLSIDCEWCRNFHDVTNWNNKSIGVYLTIITRARAIDSEAMRARGIIVSVKSN